MKLSILGKQRKGKKSFELISEDEFGYNVECIDGAGVVMFNNIQKINWLNEGEHVYLVPPPVESEPFNTFIRYDKVNIRKAKKTESKRFVSMRGY
ncbi:hypothetical protein [Pedobacter antarcticus]|uniref:hypothetical protein n=1 Tax=Pedobacter antarcticus TaxID=34086 RepID=UPI0008807FAE|nr:hypothetical protein [Pedobacter antarcticus]SDM40129.1 hypothetical protein SAMN04488084_106156 [Pedobacter antarcticus]